MTAWWGYARLEASRALTGSEKTKLLQAAQDIGTTSSSYPGKITSARASLASDKFIVETEFPLGLPTRNQFVNAIATRFGVSTAVVNALMTTVALFGTGSSTHEESAQLARDYLATNTLEWDTAPS